MHSEDKKHIQKSKFNSIQGSLIWLTIEKVREACKTLKNYRSTEPRNIPGKIIKYGTGNLFVALRNLSKYRFLA